MTSFLASFTFRNVCHQRALWRRTYTQFSKKSITPSATNERLCLAQCGCRRWFADDTKPQTPSSQGSPPPTGPPPPTPPKGKKPPSPPKAPKLEQGYVASPISAKMVAILVAGGGAVLLMMRYVKENKSKAVEDRATVGEGAISIGGAWELVDTKGKLTKSSDFHGKWTLLYFGFTHCPDVCPEELDKMIEAVDEVDDSKGCPNVTPIFISIDPDRDVGKVVAEYVSEFSPKLIGLTGTMEQVTAATKAYRVFFTQGPKDEDGDYIVDHSIITYLVNPDGTFVAHYGQTKSAKQIASDIQVKMSKYQQRK